ncbi:hypothetical protein SAMN05421505_10621 [Sinosporangium album]|uniref:Uncharacterized protein n=1 Tax=Sinosporangium album TaxID=504805 RepID=A0A1G7VSD9_9ACTN|nr:hypothetical protein SAMN05421505_10621 [Sinosporangium album]
MTPLRGYENSNASDIRFAPNGVVTPLRGYENPTVKAQLTSPVESGIRRRFAVNLR